MRPQIAAKSGCAPAQLGQPETRHGEERGTRGKPDLLPGAQLPLVGSSMSEIAEPPSSSGKREPVYASITWPFPALLAR
jgi:hypothetical protein